MATTHNSLIGLLLTVGGAAQDFLDPRRIEVPRREADTRNLFVADMNADGWLDVAVSNVPPGVFGSTFQPLHGPWVWCNDGNGRFWSCVDSVLPVFAQRLLAAEDLDGDGDRDLLLTRGVGLNDGNGGFTWQTLSIELIGREAVVLDIDGDGAMDVFTGNGLYLRQAGSMQFVDATAARLPPRSSGPPNSLAAFDVDGDGDVDFVVGELSDQDRLLLDDGTGHYVDGTSGRLPAQVTATRDLTVVDVDGDGDMDILTADGVAGARYYANDGLGNFVDVAWAFSLNAPGTALGVGDLDGDGDADLALGTVDGGLLLRNAGNGQFTHDDLAWRPGPSATGAITVFDADGDGDLDLLQGGGDIDGPQGSLTGDFGLDNRIYYNDGAGQFLGVGAETLDPGVTTDAARTAMADFDGDGSADLLATAGTGRLLFGDPWGGFDGRGLGLPVEGVPVAGDLDGDGDLDALVLDPAGAVHRLDNAGSGLLWPVTSSWLPPLPVGVSPSDLALGDVDGDGDLDAVIVTGEFDRQPFPPAAPSPLFLLLNDGSGSFANASSILPGAADAPAEQVVLGDLDGDGDLDLVTSGGLVLCKDGAGWTKVPQSWSFGDWFVVRMALADLDEDGHPDLAMGMDCVGPGCSQGMPNGVMWNDGNGVFGAMQWLGTAPTRTRAVAVGDADGDGDLDLAFGNLGLPGQPGNELVINDGGRAFRAAATLPDGWDETVDLHFGDVDRDADTDLIVVNHVIDTGGSGRTKVLRNLQRQVWAPWPPRTGRDYHVAVHGGVHGALLFAALAPAADPLLPFGVIGLDSSSRVLVAQLGPSLPPGAPTFATVVPSLPVLAGVELFWQALVLDDSPPGARLTNVHRDVIRTH